MCNIGGYTSLPVASSKYESYIHIQNVQYAPLRLRRMPFPQITPLLLSAAMEARARQRAARRKEIKELKRKKEDERLVRDGGVAFWSTNTVV